MNLINTILSIFPKKKDKYQFEDNSFLSKFESVKDKLNFNTQVRINDNLVEFPGSKEIISHNTTTEEQKICSNCGTDVSHSGKFCAKCGNKLF